MTLRLNGDNSGFTEIKAADTAGDNSIKLPASNGSANQLLQNGGTAGELQYTSAGGGLHYDSSGRLLVGTSSSLRNAGLIQIAGSTYPALDINSFGTTTNPEFVLRQARGTLGSPTIVSSGDNIGKYFFQGYDGAIHQVAASIESYVDGIPSNNVMPGKIVFSTNAGTNTITPRMEIGSNGALKLLSGCPGIDFSQIQTDTGNATSETFDSYEEGTWTPTIRENGSGPEWDTISNQSGSYTKIGRAVHIQFSFSYSAVATNVNTTFYGFIAGMPFASSATGNHGLFNIAILKSGGSTIPYHGNTSLANNAIPVFGNQDDASPGAMRTSEWPAGANFVTGNFVYYTA